MFLSVHRPLGRLEESDSTLIVIWVYASAAIVTHGAGTAMEDTRLLWWLGRTTCRSEAPIERRIHTVLATASLPTVRSAHHTADPVRLHAYGSAQGNSHQTASGRRTMTGAPPESLGTDGTRSLEVRWIFPGQLAAAVARWFGRFPAETTAVEDVYLLDPHLPGLSVKVRGGRALEVKMYRGSPGLLEVAGRARGRLESWQKWSFPHGPPSQDRNHPDGWQLVSKSRRISRFSLASGPTRAPVQGLGQKPGCAVELTEVHTRGGAWWTLGFEATGPANTLHSELKAAATQVFAEPPPGGLELGIDDSTSYAQWLRSWPDTAETPKLDDDPCADV